MENKLISFETAKLAKEKGFNIKSDHLYIGDRDIDFIQNFGTTQEVYWYAPSQSLLQKWLREVHDIHIETLRQIGINSNEVSYVSTVQLRINKNIVCRAGFKIYEESLEIGLQESIKLI